MKFCSCASIGILIGAIDTIGAITGFIYVLKLLNQTVIYDDMKTIYRIFLILFITQAILSSLLIIGVTQKQQNFILPWLILNWTCVIVNILKVLYNLEERTFTTRGFLYDLVSILIQLLLLHAVSTLYSDIRYQNAMQKHDGESQYRKRRLETILEV